MCALLDAAVELAQVHLEVELLHRAEHPVALARDGRVVGAERREDQRAHHLDRALRPRLRAEQLGGDMI